MTTPRYSLGASSTLLVVPGAGGWGIRGESTASESLEIKFAIFNEFIAISYSIGDFNGDLIGDFIGDFIGDSIGDFIGDFIAIFNIPLQYSMSSLQYSIFHCNIQ